MQAAREVRGLERASWSCGSRGDGDGGGGGGGTTGSGVSITAVKNCWASLREASRRWI